MRESIAIAARAIGQLPCDRRRLVAVVGLDGAGKTTPMRSRDSSIGRHARGFGAPRCARRRSPRVGRLVPAPESAARVVGLSVLLDVPPAVAALRLQLRDGNPARVRDAAPYDACAVAELLGEP